MNYILDQYTPEEYASFWGCDPAYCKPPQKPNDGYLFYNFGSEQNNRTKEWLTEFSEAIDRLILLVSKRGNDEEDIKGLNQLKDHVQELISEKNK